MSGENWDTGVAWSFHDATKYVWLGDEPGGRWFGMGTPPDVEAPIWAEDWSLELFLSSPRGTRLVSAPSSGRALLDEGAGLCCSKRQIELPIAFVERHSLFKLGVPRVILYRRTASPNCPDQS